MYDLGYLKTGTISFECPNPDDPTLIVSEKVAQEFMKSNLGTFTLSGKDVPQSTDSNQLPSVIDISDIDKFYKSSEKAIEENLIAGAYSGTGDISIEDIIHGNIEEDEEAMEWIKRNTFIHALLKNNFIEGNSITVPQFIERLQNLAIPIEIYNRILWKLFDISDEHDRERSVNFLKPEDSPMHQDKNLVLGKDGSMNISSIVYDIGDKIIIKILYYRELVGWSIDAQEPYRTESIGFPVGHLEKTGESEYAVDGSDGSYHTGKNRKELIDSVKQTGERIEEVYLDKIPVAKNCY